MTGPRLHSATRYIVSLAGLRSSHWAVGFIMLMPIADPGRRFALGLVLAGMLAAGNFAYTMLPRSALVYVMVMGAGGGVAFFLVSGPAMELLAIALAVYCGMLFTTSIVTARLFRSHVLHETALGEQIEFMGILLKDFEHSASDWLREMGSDQRLRRGAGRFIQNLDHTAHDIEHLGLVAVLRTQAHTEAQRQSVSRFADLLRSDNAFSDVIVSFGVGTTERFWRISAKPVARSPGGWRGVTADVTAAQKSQNQITYLAHHDALTGLPNRVLLRDSLNRAILEFSTSAAESWIACVDLDGFKSVNDLFGHLTGDRVLMAVAKRLLTRVGPTDVLSRVGGDEFMLLCRSLGTDGDIAAHVEKLIPLVSEPFDILGHNLQIGASIGIARIDHDGNTISEILRHADLALYRAKHLGKGMVCVFDESMDREAKSRRMLEHELKLAVSRKEFVLHYQPIVRMADSKLCGYEALIRWQHPTRGLMAPAEFISLAEEMGIIVQIGEWVIFEACRQASRLPEYIRLAVNLAPLQVKESRLVNTVSSALAESGLKAQRLELEITESALLEQTSPVLATLRELKALGVRIGLDDFGTGYSSLGCLHQYAFDNIKIDKSFVQSMSTRPESNAVVKAVLMLADELGISTTAEGIETEQQFIALKSRGCHEAQGYYFGKPALLPGNLEIAAGI